MTPNANPPRHDLKTRAEDAGFKAVRALARALPLDAASRLGAVSWGLLAPLNKRHRRAERQLRIAYPQSSAAWRATVLQAMWANLGATFAEGLQLDRIAAEPDRVRLHMSEDARRALEKHGGNAVFASLHMGNWEVAVVPLLRMGYAPAGIYQRVRNPLVEAQIAGSRASLYPGGLMPKGSATARAALKLVRGGGMIAIMADLRDRQGISVPYFGRPAPSTPFPAMLARSCNVPLIAGRVLRTGPARFSIDAKLIDVPTTADRAADVEAATRSLHALFERWVRERPEQWMWGHRRWGAVAIRSERREAATAEG